MERMKILRKLPSTAETEEGPIIDHRLRGTTIRYDYEGPTGAPDWVTIQFSSGGPMRFTHDPACTELMIGAYSAVAEIQDSEWIAALNLATSIERERLPDSLKHFVVYFDHYGCIEVVAASFEVEGA